MKKNKFTESQIVAILKEADAVATSCGASYLIPRSSFFTARSNSLS
jgi:hypothetical protein